MGEGRDEPRGAGHGADQHVDVIALVLGDVDGQQRAAMAAHLLRCSTCRSEYDEAAATVGELLPIGPAVQPPLGFDEQVLGRMGRGTATGSGRGTSLRRRRSWLAGVAAAVAVAAGAIGGWWATRVDDTAVADVTALELINGGDPVGTVSLGDVDGETVMVVALVDAPDDVSYLCRTTFADGRTAESEAWPPGNGAWIVPLPPDAEPIRTVELVVNGTDKVWSAASFTR